GLLVDTAGQDHRAGTATLWDSCFRLGFRRHLCLQSRLLRADARAREARGQGQGRIYPSAFASRAGRGPRPKTIAEDGAGASGRPSRSAKPAAQDDGGGAGARREGSPPNNVACSPPPEDTDRTLMLASESCRIGPISSTARWEAGFSISCRQLRMAPSV